MKLEKVLFILKYVLIVVLVVSAVLIFIQNDRIRTIGFIGLPVAVVGFITITFIDIISKKKTGSVVDTKTKARLKHVGGLPVVKDALVDVYYTPQEIVFVKDTQTIKVSAEKVIGIDRVSSKDVNARISGAAAGLFLFGAMGMAAGALSEKYFLVISYKSDDETKFITFEEGDSAKFTKEIMSRFQNEHPKTTEIVEL